MVRMALMRRGLAMDQCNLLQYQIHDQWVENILGVGTEAPMDGFMSVTNR